MTDDGILIVPVEQHVDNGVSAEDMATELDEVKKQTGLRAFLTRKISETFERRQANRD